MYKTIIRNVVRQTFVQLSRGEHERALRKFARDAHFRFAGDNAMACDLHDRELVVAWFDRAFRLFPGLAFHPQTILVRGWPWRTYVATHFEVSATLPGSRPYRNAGMQLLVLRWGRVVEDLIYEDTQAMNEALEYLGTHGHEEATAAPVGSAA